MEIRKKKRFLKCIMTAVLTLCMIAGLMVVDEPMEAEAMTTQSAAVDWIRAQNGKSIDMDGQYGAQCVDLIVAYFDYLGVARIWGNAKDYATKNPPAGWQKIQGAAVQPGDIVIWTGGEYGHVALAVSNSRIMHQNWNYKQYCQETDIFYSNWGLQYWGVWRPNFNEDPIIPIGSPIEGGSRTISDGDYHIVSALEGTCVDGIRYYPGSHCLTISGLPGTKNSQGANVELWSVLGHEDHVFTVTWLGDGYYKIKLKNSDSQALDVYGASLLRGTNVQQWDDHGGNSQQWVIKETDGRGYTIQAKCNGWYLDVTGGMTDNGTNIRLWEGNDSDAERWYFIPWSGGNSTVQEIPDGEYRIVTLPMNSRAASLSVQDGNIELGSNNEDDRQIFNVRWLGDGYYEIVQKNSNLSLDVDHVLCKDGANVMLSQPNKQDNQKWIIRPATDNIYGFKGYYNIISKCNGLYLDLASLSTDDGTNVQMHVGGTRYGGLGQMWGLVRCDRGIDVEQVSLDKSTLTIQVGKQAVLKAAVSPENATDKTLTWESSNTAVAQVSASGTVTAKSAGTARITVKSANGKTASCQVTVSALPSPTATPKPTPTPTPVPVKVGAVKFAVAGVIGGRNVTFNTDTKNAVIYYSAKTSNLTTNDTCVKPGETVLFENFYGTIYARAYANGQWSNVSRLTLKIPVVNKPTITSKDGVVTIKTTTPDSYIYYTTDGSTPSPTHGTKLTKSGGSFTVSANCTVKAIAVRSCFTNSEIASTKATAKKLGAPSFAVKGVIGGREVTFNSTEAKGEIYYSFTTSNITTKDLHVKSGEKVLFQNYYGTVYARTYVNGQWSNVSRLVLKIPVVNKPTITAAGSGKVKISTSTPNCAIYYTTDGSTPSPTNGKRINASSSVVTVGSGKTVKAIAVRSCFTNSDVATYR